MKLKRSPLSVALIALGICAAIGLGAFMVFGDHSYSIHRSEHNETFGQYVGYVSAGIATIAYLVQRRRVNAQWAAASDTAIG